VAFDASGDRLVTGGSGHDDVVVWNSATGKALYTITDARAASGTGQAFVGDLLALALVDGDAWPIGLFDGKSGKHVRDLAGPAQVTAMAALGDDVLVCGARDGVVTLLHKNGTVLARAHAFGGIVRDILALDADRFACCSDDGWVRVFSRALMALEPARITEVEAAYASKRGARAVVESRFGCEIVDDDGARRFLPGLIECTAVSADGRAVAFAENLQRIGIDVDGSVRTLLPLQHNIDALAFSPDGKRLAAIEGRTIHVIDVATGEMRSTAIFWNNPTSIIWHPQRPLVVGVARTGDVKAIHAETGDVDAEAGSTTHGEFPQMHPDGERSFGPHALSQRRDLGCSFLVVNDRRPNSPDATVTIPRGLVPYQEVPAAVAAVAHRGEIVDAAYLVQQRLFVTAGSDGTVRTWSEAGAPVGRYDCDGPLGAVCAGDDVIVAVLRNGSVVRLVPSSA
jgi:WD40 repeat protein